MNITFSKNSSSQAITKEECEEFENLIGYKLPEDYTIDPESIIDDLEQQASFNNIEDMKTEPEEYISIPPEMAYTEESTQFDFRQFAGAGAIIRNK